MFVFCFIFCNLSVEESSGDVDMEEEKESDDSDEENYMEKVQDTENTDLGEDIHQLSKSEEKELRKFRKVDYSWIAAL